MVLIFNHKGKYEKLKVVNRKKTYSKYSIFYKNGKNLESITVPT